MRALLIPVKSLSHAKQRLAPCLTQAQRTALAEAMLADVFAAAAEVRGVDRVCVVSNYPRALNLAEEKGWMAIPEDTQVSESDSVDFGSRLCAEQGITSLLRLPIDIPLVQPRDIEALFAVGEAGAPVVMVSSRGGTGTNALLRTPPTLFPSHFGPESLAKHLAEARRRSVACRVVRNPRIELDIDDEEDLRTFLAMDGHQSATGRCLASLGF